MSKENTASGSALDDLVVGYLIQPLDTTDDVNLVMIGRSCIWIDLWGISDAMAVCINPLMVLSFKTFQNLLTGKMAINMSEPFKTLHNFLLLHYHTFQYPLKGFKR